MPDSIQVTDFRSRLTTLERMMQEMNGRGAVDMIIVDSIAAPASPPNQFELAEALNARHS